VSISAPTPTAVPPHPLRPVIARLGGLTRMSLVTGIPVTSLSAVQCGRRPMPRRLTESLAALGVDTDRLIGEVANWRLERRRAYSDDLRAGRCAPDLTATR
jgi:hypothetical protein